MNLGWTKNAAYSGMGAVFGAVAVITLLITTFGVKEIPNPDLKPAEMPALKQIKFVFKNRPFVQYMIMSTIISISFTLLTSLLPYYLTYQLKMTSEISYVMFVMPVSVSLIASDLPSSSDVRGQAPVP